MEKINHKKFLDLIKERNPLFLENFEIMDEYINNSTKIHCRCKKCGEINCNKPYKIYIKSECSICKNNFKIDKQKVKEEKFKNKFKKKGNQSIEIIGEYVDCKHKIKCRCKEYGHEFEITPDKLINRGSGCPICNGHICQDGFNSVADKRPDLIKYFINKEDAHKYTVSSNKRLKFKCPDCGYIKDKEIAIGTLSLYGFSCDKCNDKISFPNKILRNLLINLKEDGKIKEWKTEFQPKWAKPYRYDGYLLNKNEEKILLEFDGEQHYKSGKFKIFNENSKEIDNLKDNLAIENGFKIIRINCIKSDFDFIKNNILKSNLKEYVDLSDINWRQIELDINKNFMIEVCKKYNDSESTLEELSKEFNCCKATITKAIKRGFKLNLCKYDTKEFAKRKRNKKGLLRLNIFDKDNKLLAENLTVAESIEFLKEKIDKNFSEKGADNGIRACIQGKFKKYKGFIFKEVSKQNE